MLSKSISIDFTRSTNFLFYVRTNILYTHLKRMYIFKQTIAQLNSATYKTSGHKYIYISLVYVLEVYEHYMKSHEYNW